MQGKKPWGWHTRYRGRKDEEPLTIPRFRNPRKISMNIFELHKKMTAKLFPAWSSMDERFLALALAGEAGELANMIKKRWRDDATLTSEVQDEIADIRVYLMLIAKCFSLDDDVVDIRAETVMVEGDLNDERFLSLSLCARIGLIAGMVEERWIGNPDLEESICDEIVETRVRLELLAAIFNIGGTKLDDHVEKKLAKVMAKHGIVVE
jgi:NTP pyrophosphatase (non-canonical NTP hydrolase)